MLTNLTELFDATVLAHGADIAVEHHGETITFSALQARARAMGGALARRYGTASRMPVAVFLPKEIATIAADIGIMYACRPFMNLDTKTPMERIANILETVQPVAVVTSTRFAKQFQGGNVDVIEIETLDETASSDVAYLESIRQQWIDTDPMCIINTSGSTGTPKGVVLNTRSFLDFLHWADETFSFDGSEIIGSLSPVVFDIFDFELMMLMAHGSKLVLLDAMLAVFPARLLQTMQAAQVNFIFWVPSIMVNIANMGLLDKLSLDPLKLVWFAGEVFPTKQFNVWYDHLPQATFVNLYGPIEITLDCIFHIVTERPEEGQPLPIGVPCHNTDILLLDEAQHLCKRNEEGEICVRGTSLAMGYYNQPEKTAAAFVQNPLNHAYPELIYRTGDMAYVGDAGLYHFKGRKDTLIKHMGYRIELGEIEHVLENDLKLVKYCCAVYQSAKKEIVLFYESGTADIDDKSFRKTLAQAFPSYMLPKVFVRLQELPRNTNGKIDRQTLKRIANEFETVEAGLEACGLQEKEG